MTAYHDNPEIEAFLAEIDEGGTIEAADLDALELGPQCFDLVVVELRGERERVEVGSLDGAALIDLLRETPRFPGCRGTRSLRLFSNFVIRRALRTSDRVFRDRRIHALATAAAGSRMPFVANLWLSHA